MIVGTHIAATEVKVLKTYKDSRGELALINWDGRNYIGWKTDFYFDTNYEIVSYNKKHYEIIDDDADHLNRPEFEGVFESRCDDFFLELAALSS